MRFEEWTSRILEITEERGGRELYICIYIYIYIHIYIYIERDIINII